MRERESNFLESWKEIAAFISRDERTAMRWAKHKGMPVRRVPGGKRGRVFAYAEEIQRWLDQDGTGRAEPGKSGKLGGEATVLQFPGEPGPPEAPTKDNNLPDAPPPGPPDAVLAAWAAEDARRRRVRTWWALGSAALVLMATAAVVVRVRAGGGLPAQPATARLGGDFIEAKDPDGRVLWTHRFPQPVSKEYVAAFQEQRLWPRVADFYRDGQREVAAIVPLRSGPNEGDDVQTDIEFFSSSGRLLWKYLPEKTLQFGTHALKGPWFIHDMLVSNADGRSTLWVTSGHHTWANAFVVQLDPRTGAERLRFVNTGVAYTLGEVKTKAATFLLVGGFNNEWDSGSLAIFNEDRSFGASPQTPGSRHECVSCPPGVPDYYFVFPRSEVNKISGEYEDPVMNIRLINDGIEVNKHERGPRSKEVTLYLLAAEPPFGLISLRYNSEYDMLHREWSTEGKLAHTLEDCPERMHPSPVRLWTPAHGWTDLPVAPAAANQ